MSEYLEMPSGNVWELGGDYDPTTFFEALRLFADDQKLNVYLEGVSPEIRNVLLLFEAESANPIRFGTIWPKSAKMHLSLTPSLIDKLIAISDEHAVPDYADHIVVYGNEVVLEAYDFTTAPYQISGAVDEDLVREFARISGNNYRTTTV